MNEKNNYLYGRESEKLQIPYGEYIALMEKVEEATRIRQLKATVVSDLQGFLEGGEGLAPVVKAKPKAMPKKEAAPEPAPVKEPEPEVVSVEFPAEDPEPEKAHTPPVPHKRQFADMAQVPPIKKDIAQHFNKYDASGRLFNVFKQYYTCLNNSCGGTVRVTMKDGSCSLWNYDEWEEFAFVDIFEGHLRIAIDPHYTDALKALSLCEVPRLLSGRRNVICVQVDDLNNIVLDVLARAFGEVGMQTK